MAVQIDQSSPQVVSAGFRAALIEKAWRRAFAFMVPELQANMLGGLFMGAGFSTDGDRVASEKLAKLMQRYGISKHVKLDPDTIGLAAVFGDLMKWSDRYLPDDRKLDLVENLVQCEHSEFRIDGDFASAISTLQGKRNRIRFQRIDDRWYLI